MKIEKTEYSYQVTECDIKFGEQITLGEELLIPISDIEGIKAEIENLITVDLTFYDGVNKLGNSEHICKDEVLEIIDKYIRKESENADSD